MEVSAPPRPVEPRPPAATCGPPSRPQCPRPPVKPPSKIKTARQVDHTPVGPKHLKSVVLAEGGVQPSRRTEPSGPKCDVGAEASGVQRADGLLPGSVVAQQ